MMIFGFLERIHTMHALPVLHRAKNKLACKVFAEVQNVSSLNGQFFAPFLKNLKKRLP